MSVIQLPSDSYYISVDRAVLARSMSRIEEQFRDLLVNGTQAQGLPEDIYAAGQYLNPYSINQRGLYGTAATLLVLSRSSPTTDRIRLIEGLIKYIATRPRIEQDLATNDADRSLVMNKLATEWNTAFKCADLLYAVSATPAAANGREDLSALLLQRLDDGRRTSGGWAADLDPGGPSDALATAAVIRALHSAGVPVQDVDVESTEQNLLDTQHVSPFIRMFCLLVLTECGAASESARNTWPGVLRDLRPQLQERTEANHEFTLGNRYAYVRIPWQLYLIQYASIRNPLLVLFNRDIRDTILTAIEALSSSHGYVYGTYGHMKSTRTYGILMDTLWKVDRALNSSSYLIPIANMANWGARILYSRITAVIAFIAALCLGLLAVWSWIQDRKQPIAAVGSELAAALLLAIISFLLGHIRRR